MAQLESMKDKERYYVFNFGGRDIVERISIDFEPVLITMPFKVFESFTDVEYGSNRCNLGYYQSLIDTICERLGRPQRRVFALKDAEVHFNGKRKNNRAGRVEDNIYEYVGRSQIGYIWWYYTSTKTMNIINFYKWRELMIDNDFYDDENRYFDREDLRNGFRDHFSMVEYSLKYQGLPIKTYYDGPSHKLVDLLTKNLLKNGNRKRIT